ncbi:MAG: galactokinase [Verrucomicrobiales bacterium]|nr:galactokinase [Verrucomicrobiales bacterium]
MYSLVELSKQAFALDPMPQYEQQFYGKFGNEPSIRIEAPGRVNLIGEHIDYLDGWVMPAAIEPRITMLAAPGSPGGDIEVWTTEHPEKFHHLRVDDFSIRTAPDERWLNYMIGVLGVYAEKGVTSPGCRIAVYTTLPPGAGLSSSAALETAMALLIETLSDRAFSLSDRARFCQRAEHEWVGMPCGIMDQLTVGAGVADHVLKIDCKDLTVEPVRLPGEICLVVADSGVKHSLAEGEYRNRRADCEAALEKLAKDSWRNVTIDDISKSRDLLGDRLFRRSRHAVTELLRVADFASALSSNDSQEMARLMYEGHQSLRDDYEVSCPELDLLVEAGREFGTSGSRMTGGGFGGSTIHLVREAAADDLVRLLEKRYFEAYGKKLHSFRTRASSGACCTTTIGK